jgi:hypothetical protein
VADEVRGEDADLRVDRGLLQPAETALDARLSLSGPVRGKTTPIKKEKEREAA